jgi:hypothetical protein
MFSSTTQTTFNTKKNIGNLKLRYWVTIRMKMRPEATAMKAQMKQVRAQGLPFSF